MDAWDPEQYVMDYLPRLGREEGAFFALIERREGILPLLVKAFRSERDPGARSSILEVIWQHRDPAIVSVLAEALADPAPVVWKEALNGLVALDLPECLAALEAERGRSLDPGSQATARTEWIDEAIHQLRVRRG